MRALSNKELVQIEKSIQKKGLQTAELLAEIYDHYISHLENFPEGNFIEQLEALDQKWTYSYCHKLQHDLAKNINKSIRTLQWAVIKSYFTWPRMVFTLTLIGILTILVDMLAWKTQVLVFFGIPLVYIAVFMVFILVRTRMKTKQIRKLFNTPYLKVSSSYSSHFLIHLAIPFNFFNVFINLPRIFGLHQIIPDYLINFLSVTFCFIIVLHSLTISEAWKIKSKTAFI